MFSLIPLPYKILAGLALLAGVFFYGYMKGSVHAEAELQRFAAKHAAQVAELEKKNAEISGKVVTEFVDRTNTIREKEIVYVDSAKKHLPPGTMLSNGWVYTHDVSATNGDADSTRVADATPSGIETNQALISVIGNYSRCEQNAQQLIALQKWINDNKAAIDRMNEEAKKKK